MITISLIKNLEIQLNYLLCLYLKLFGMKWIPPQYTFLFSMPHTEFNGYFWGWWWAWKDTSAGDSEILFSRGGSLGEVWFGAVSVLPRLGSSRSSLGWGHRLGWSPGWLPRLCPVSGWQSFFLSASCSPLSRPPPHTVSALLWGTWVPSSIFLTHSSVLLSLLGLMTGHEHIFLTV